MSHILAKPSHFPPAAGLWRLDHLSWHERRGEPGETLAVGKEGICGPAHGWRDATVDEHSH